VKLSTCGNSVCLKEAWQLRLEHWKNDKLKCSKISKFQNHKINMQQKYTFYGSYRN